MMIGVLQRISSHGRRYDLPTVKREERERVLHSVVSLVVGLFR